MGARALARALLVALTLPLLAGCPTWGQADLDRLEVACGRYVATYEALIDANEAGKLTEPVKQAIRKSRHLADVACRQRLLTLGPGPQLDALERDVKRLQGHVPPAPARPSVDF